MSFFRQKEEQPSNNALLERIKALEIEMKGIKQEQELHESNFKSWKSSIIQKYRRIQEQEEEEESSKEEEEETKDINASLGFKF